MLSQSNLHILVVSNVINTTEITGKAKIKFHECHPKVTKSMFYK